MPEFKKVGKFIEFIPAAEDLKEASNRAAALGVLPNSFTNGAGRMTGFLGEVAFERYYGNTIYKGDVSYTHDYVINNKKVEIKSKTCSSRPKPEYMASVNGKQDKVFENDIFFFNRVSSSLSRVWMLGWISRKSFFKHALFIKEGESADDGFTQRASGFHLPISKLRSPDSLIRPS